MPIPLPPQIACIERLKTAYREWEYLGEECPRIISKARQFSDAYRAASAILLAEGGEIDPYRTLQLKEIEQEERSMVDRAYNAFVSVKELLNNDLLKNNPFVDEETRNIFVVFNGSFLVGDKKTDQWIEVPIGL